MFNTHSVIEVILILAGAGQLALALSSLAIPYLLDWREELQALKPLTRGVFWTYSSYTFATNVWFGVMSIAAAGPLAAGGLLARLVTGFITLYWGMRIVVQFTLYDRSVVKERLLFRFAEIAYLMLFVSLTLIFGFVTLRPAFTLRACEGIGLGRGNRFFLRSRGRSVVIVTNASGGKVRWRTVPCSPCGPFRLEYEP
jgi:hypothetical protein